MFNKFNPAAANKSGQPASARSGYDRVWITPTGYEAFNPATDRPVYNWTVIAVEACSGPYSQVLEEIDACTTFSQALEISQALSRLERARGRDRRYCVRRVESKQIEVDIHF
jgi:hypothetical protein